MLKREIDARARQAGREVTNRFEQHDVTEGAECFGHRGDGFGLVPLHVHIGCRGIVGVGKRAVTLRCDDVWSLVVGEPEAQSHSNWRLYCATR